ncbi:MAG: hypothetical protein ACHQVK_03840 [Candidatus Paceibacterales bacterium]
MKKFFMALIITGISLSAGHAQQNLSDQPTAVVINAFKTKFPAAEQIHWGGIAAPANQSPRDYAVTFINEGKKYAAIYRSDGKFTQIDGAMDFDNVPPAVKQTIAKKFSGYKPQEVTQHETREKGIVYAILLVKDKENCKVDFSPNGDVITNYGQQKLPK